MRFKPILFALSLFYLAFASAQFSSLSTIEYIQLPSELADIEPVLNYPNVVQQGDNACFVVVPTTEGTLKLTYNSLCQYCGAFGLIVFNPFRPDEPIVPEISMPCTADLLIVSTQGHSPAFYNAVRVFISAQAQLNVSTRYVELSTMPATGYNTLYAPGAFFDGDNYERAIQQIVTLTNAKSLIIVSDEIPRKQIEFAAANISIETDDDYGVKQVKVGRKLLQQNIPVSRISGSEGEILASLFDILPQNKTLNLSASVIYSDAAAFQETPNVAFPVTEDPVGVSSAFGPRTHPITGSFQNHNALDLSTENGTKVYAPVNGTAIALPVDDKCGVGLKLISENYTFGFCHLSQVKKTGKVNRGDLIALSGNTGSSTGPHLHYTTRYRGEPVDPLVVHLNTQVPIFVNPTGYLTANATSHNNQSTSKLNALLYGDVIEQCASRNQLDPALLWQLKVNYIATGATFNCNSDSLVTFLKSANITKLPQEDLIRLTGKPIFLHGKLIAQPAYLFNQANNQLATLAIYKSSNSSGAQSQATLAFTAIVHDTVLKAPPVIPLNQGTVSIGDILVASKAQIIRDVSVPVRLRVLQAKAVSMQGNPAQVVKIT